MRKYIIKRFFHSVVLVLLVIIISFFIFRLMPGDPSVALLDPSMPPGVRERMIHEFGLDRPIHEQFVEYMKQVFHGNLGLSFYYKETRVTEIIFGLKFVNTLILMTLSLSLSIIFGTCLGVIAGWKQGKLTDYLLTNVGLVAYSMPVFWSGLLVLLFMGFHLGIIPLGGVKSYGTEMSLMGIIWDRIIHLVGPVLVLCILFTGQFLIIMRNTIIDVFSQDFMKMALAKGLKNKTIIFRYAMRNALLPTISLSAALLSLLIGGATMTEVVFSYNGIGRLIYDSVLRRDYPVLQGVFIVMALLVIVANFIADMLYAYFDPRIKYA